MKSRTIIFTQSLLVLFSSMLVLSGCVKEQVESNPIKDGEKEVVFAIHVPSGAGGSSQSPKTRAIEDNGTEDNYVNEVDILMFDAAGKFLQNVWCENVAQSVGSDIKVKNVKVRLPKGTGYTFVLLANSHQFYITNALDAGDDISKMYDLAALLGTFGAKWNSIPGHDDYKRFPMWGQISGVTIDETNKTFNVDAYRMFAKVNVAVDYSQSADFELQSVAVYNYNKSGFLVPDATKFAAGKPTEKIDRESGSSPTPLLYSNTNSDGIGGANYRYINNNATVKRYECIDEIFIPESAGNTGAWAWDNNTCIVIGGTYKDAPAFYRLDFVKSNVNIDVRRNWKYLFEVGTIKTPGYADEQTALKNKPDNIEYTVHPWDEQNIGDLIVEGAIQLSISPKSTFTFSRDTETQGVDIYTNWSEGWQVQKLPGDPSKYRIEDAQGNLIDWITLDHYGTTAAGEKKLNIAVKNNDSGFDRTGFIYITTKGDRIQHRLTVEQSNETKSLLVITDGNDLPITEMIFVAAPNVVPAEQTFKVKWAPTSQTLYSSAENVSNPKGGYFPLPSWEQYLVTSKDGIININSAPNVYVANVNNTSGEMTFIIKPKAISTAEITADPFFERQVEVKYRISTPQGLLRQNVAIQQIVPNMVPKAEDYYLANSSSYTFNVKSNRPWKAYLIDNGGGMVTSPTVNSTTPFATGGYNLPDGANLGFTTVDDLSNPTLILGTAKVRIEWLSGDDPANSAHWTTASVDLQCRSRVEPGSNSYMVNGTNNIDIPTRQVAIAMGFNDKPTEQAATDGYLGMGWIAAADYAKLKVDLLWTDIPKMLGADDAVVKSATYDGKHVAAGKIVVTPGTGVGNSVICLYVDNNDNGTYDTGDVIKWSWHIWNAGVYYPYNPDGTPNTTWMDRNLGATTNSYIVNSPSTLGLYYQWGRKDPMPGAASHSQADNTVGCTYYLGNNTPTTAVPAWTTGQSLANSILKPLQSYTDWTGSNNHASWITNNDPANGKGDKTIYDPCPDGWQVPVRANKTNIASTHHWGNDVSITISSHASITWTSFGINWVPKGGYYPAAGVRNSAGLTQVGKSSFHWSASPLVPHSYFLSFDHITLTPSHYSNGGSRPNGFSIRCVAEQP